MISLDWFQISATRNPKQCLSAGMYFQGTHPTEEGKLLTYSTEQPKEFNALFGNCLSVQMHGFPLATIMCEPRVTTIKRQMCLVKVANPLLYSGQWLWYLQDILDALQWKFHAISRVDVCCDFNYFYGGLAPAEFIRRYLHSGRYDVNNPSYYRVGSNKYETIGKKVIKDEGLAEHVSEYLRFGTRSTGVCVYLYNKTKELDEKGNKKYIRECWKEFGLTDTPEEPVFRLELSIMTGALQVKRRFTEEQQQERAIAHALYTRTLRTWNIGALCMSDFMTQSNVENVFWAYASKYFRFKIVGTQKFPHNWKDVVLFDADMITTLKPFRISRQAEAGVAERNASKVLQRVLQNLQTIDLEDKVILAEAANILERHYHLKKDTPYPGQARKVIDALQAGHTWQEIKALRVASATQLEGYKDIINRGITAALQPYFNDADCMRAIDKFEADRQLIAEDAKVLGDVWL